MKRFLILSALLLPLNLLAQQSYHYDKVSVTMDGADNFSMDKAKSKIASGKIVLKNNKLFVNGRTFELTKKRDNLFKIKAGHVEFVYNDRNYLDGIRISKFSTSYYYHMSTAQSVAKHEITAHAE